ncbi:hypothetical protein ASD56_02130 [Microbacterium sp. Root166]|nr:hypothetical protein ASD56_02130 [Microbacterium sp. Root166]
MFVVGLIFLLLIISVIPWRSAMVYEGGIDSVVIAKALVALITLGGAFLLWVHTTTKVPIGLGPAGILFVILLVSLLASVVSGNVSATLVLVIRVVMVMVTVLLLLSCVPWHIGLGSLMAAMGLIAIVAAVTGLPSLASEGRLGGGVPEIHPNELAGLAGPPLVALVVLMLRTRVRPWSMSAAVVLLAILIASGSRTALLGVIVTIAVAVITNGIRNRGVVYLLLGGLPLAYAIALFTGIVSDLATRGGSTDTTSALDSRFDAWKVVLGWDWASWEKWIGLGLSVKQVKVDIQWRDEQVLDSSWASLLAQTGLLGTALAAGLVAWCLIAALISSSRRGVLLPLLVLLVMRSVTESGLVDSAMPFIQFLVIATLLTHRSRHADDPSAPHDLQRTPSVPRAAVT